MKRLIHRMRNSCGTHLMAMHTQTKTHMKAPSNDFDFDIHGNIRLAQTHRTFLHKMCREKQHNLIEWHKFMQLLCFLAFHLICM